MDSKKPHSVPLNYHLHTCPAEDWPNFANKSLGGATGSRFPLRNASRRLYKQDLRIVRRCEFEHRAVIALLLYDNNSHIAFIPYLRQRIEYLRGNRTGRNALRISGEYKMKLQHERLTKD